MGSPLSAGLIGIIALSVIFPYKLQGQCGGTPPVAFNPYSFKIGDSHTYNPYSSKDNDVANINHEPKMPGEKGHWVSKTYHVSCCSDEGLFKQTYITSVVVSESTKQVATYGNGLQVSNASDKYPVYFGVDGLLNDKLGPRESKIIHLPRYQPGTGQKHAVVANLYVKYWDDGGGAISGPCETDPSVWYDDSTGFTWTRNSSGTDFMQAQAVDYCRNLGTAGHHDWRLPSLAEMETVFDMSTDRLKKEDIVVTGHLWTSSMTSPEQAWLVGRLVGANL